jgi:excisionase family DNA binding protein
MPPTVANVTDRGYSGFCGGVAWLSIHVAVIWRYLDMANAMEGMLLSAQRYVEITTSRMMQTKRRGGYMAVATITDIEGLPAILTMRHVQEILGISRVKAYELPHTRGFPVVRIGRAIRVPREAFLRWLERQAGVEEG